MVKETNVVTGDITDYLYGDDLIKQSRAANDSYFLYDGLGSTRALTNNTGVITDTYNYESFGTLLNQTGTSPNDYLYTGEQFDGGLDNYYLRARYYDQGIGRFTQMDTWMGSNSDPVTLHKYLYANVDPVNMIDPSGNFSMVSVMSAVNIASTLATVAQASISVFQIASGDKEFSALELGTEILLSRLGGPGAQKVIGLIGKKGKELLKNSFDTIGCYFNSFPAGTLVLTESGLVRIETIAIGDKVMSYDEKTGVSEYKEVTHLITNTGSYNFVTLELKSGEVVEVTPEHPFYIGGEWIDANKISMKDVLLGYSEDVSLSNVSRNIKNSTVYNFTVSGFHTYYVGRDEILVHNKNKSAGCKFRGLKAKGYKWDDILRKHSPGGRTNKQRSRANHTEFTGLTDRQIKARVKAAWKNRELRKSQTSVNKITGKEETRMYYEGVDPKSGQTIGIYFDRTNQIVESAFPL